MAKNDDTSGNSGFKKSKRDRKQAKKLRGLFLNQIDKSVIDAAASNPTLNVNKEDASRVSFDVPAPAAYLKDKREEPNFDTSMAGATSLQTSLESFTKGKTGTVSIKAKNNPYKTDPDYKFQDIETILGKNKNDANEKTDIDTKLDKDNAFSLRYRIPKKLQNIEKKKLKDLSTWISRQIRDIEQERKDFMDKLVRYRSTWLDFVSAGMQDKAWDGAHDVHIPIVFEKIKAMHARIYQAVLGMDPIFALKPRSIVAEKQRYEKEQLLHYVVKDYANEGSGWEQVIDMDIWNFVSDGTSITKHSWLRDVRKSVNVTEEQIGYKNGKILTQEVEEETEEIVFDGPVFSTVSLDNFYITGTNVDNADKADLVAEKCQFTRSDLVKLTKLGFFMEDAAQKVLAKEPNNRNMHTNVNEAMLKDQQQVLAGMDYQDAGIRTYDVYETYCRYDIDDDGIDEELVVWQEKSSNLIIRITFLDRVGPGGRRPFVIKRFIDRPGSPYGIGMGEMMYGINNGLDYITNQRLDYGTLQNLPFGFYRAASGINPKKIQLKPGTLYPTDDPQTDVSFPRLNGGTAYGFQEEAQFSKYGDRLSGISEFSQGVMNGQGATRTATGTAALVNELNANLDIHIKRYQRGFKTNLSILDKQVTELFPLHELIRILGTDGKTIIKNLGNREPLRFNADFELTANSVNSNKAVQRETAGMFMQALQNPLALQGGIVSPLNLYNVYKDYLQAHEKRDIDAYITRPEESPNSPYTAKDELTMILGGVKPPVFMRDRHAEKLAFFDEFEASEELGLFDSEQLAMYRSVKQEHMKFMDAIQSQTITPSAGGGPIAPQLAAQIAASSGAPNGVPQQMGDLTAGQGSGIPQQ